MDTLTFNPDFQLPEIRPDFSDGESLSWRLRRNCRLSPRQLGMILSGIATPPLLIGIVFWIQGAPIVFIFAVMQLFLLVASFLVYARHANDAERITVSPGFIAVDITSGTIDVKRNFNTAFAKLELLPDKNDLIRISESGRCVHLGYHLPGDMRRKFFEELSLAVLYRQGRAPG